MFKFCTFFASSKYKYQSSPCYVIRACFVCAPLNAFLLEIQLTIADFQIDLVTVRLQLHQNADTEIYYNAINHDKKWIFFYYSAYLLVYAVHKTLQLIYQLIVDIFVNKSIVQYKRVNIRDTFGIMARYGIIVISMVSICYYNMFAKILVNSWQNDQY